MTKVHIQDQANLISEQQRKFHKVNEIIDKHDKKRTELISILQEVQAEYRYLPEEILTYVATTMDISPANVYGVATFYSQFSLTPKGQYEIKVCDGTACHVRASTPVLKAIRDHLKLTKEKTTTDDLKFSLETVSCLGACGLAPVVVINDKVYPQMTPDSIRQVLNGLIAE